MEIVWIIVIGFIFLVGKMFYDQNNERKLLEFQLGDRFGKVPTKEYTAEKFESIKKFYQSIKEEGKDVDDTTWNDVDMDDIFMLLNSTCSSVGEEYLYAMLRKLKFDDKKLKELDALSDYFAEHPKERRDLQLLLCKMGCTNRISVYEYINALDKMEGAEILPHILQALGLIASVGVIFITPLLGVLLSIGMLAYNVITYFKAKQKMDAYLVIVAYISRILGTVKEVSKLQIELIEPYTKELRECASKLSEFKRGTGLIGNGSGSIADVLMDYIRILFHVDIIQFNRLVKVFRKHRAELNIMYADLGFLDSAIAVASFRKLVPYYSKPVLLQNKKPGIQAKELYHVMIANPVVNSIDEKRSVLITGSNASGKSTFIKTLAINAILSQTIYTSLSKEYIANYFIVASSMALRDDILSKESYYIVEIKSLKRIMDRLNPEIPMLCFVDEVLRGTNTLERIAASSEILYSLARANALCFAATHDIELTHILEEYYSNYHFQEQIVDNNILFDYKLYEGRAVSKNAIKLLGIIGYSEDIINKATTAANHFLEEGEWDKIVR